MSVYNVHIANKFYFCITVYIEKRPKKKAEGFKFLNRIFYNLDITKLNFREIFIFGLK
jgi:hypothetical protein